MKYKTKVILTSMSKILHVFKIPRYCHFENTIMFQSTYFGVRKYRIGNILHNTSYWAYVINKLMRFYSQSE